MVAKERIISLLRSYLGYSEEEAQDYVKNLEKKIKTDKEANNAVHS